MTKRTVTMLALTLGLSALNSISQEEGSPPERPDSPPPGRQEKRFDRAQTRPEGAYWNNAERTAPPRTMRPEERAFNDMAGPPRRWNREPSEPAPEARGLGFGPRGWQREQGVCPRCGREFGPAGPARRYLGPPLARGEGPGPGFGLPSREGRAPGERDRPEGPDMEGQRPPLPPLIRVLDANGDGKIDEREMDHASAALKTLDRNGDGILTIDEIRPRMLRRSAGFGFDRGPGRFRQGGGPAPGSRERRGEQPQRPPTE
jgi:hypothetical protein